MITGPFLLVAFAISISILLVAIIRFRLNPFIALLTTSLITGFLVKMPLTTIASSISSGFGNTLGGVGIVIGLGIILGQLLSEARAVNSIADGMMRIFGKRHQRLAVTLSGWLISIPVFQDAAFVILTPLVKQIRRATKQPYVSLVCALGVGTIAAHSLVIPTPGPVAVAGNMNVSISSFLFYSLIVSLPATIIGGAVYGGILAKKTKKDEYAIEDTNDSDSSDNSQMPSLGLSLLTLTFPLILILVGSVGSLLLPSDSVLKPVFTFFGDKNIALLIGVGFAVFMLRKYFRKATNEIIIEACTSAGLIFLITGSGGSLGSVLNTSGIGPYLVETMQGFNISLIVLGFVLSQLLRSAQGSTTVALVTTSSILGPIVATTPYSPVLVGLAICAGGIGGSLPNDSGFWVLSRYSGLKVEDTIKAWTLGGTVVGVTAFIIILVLSLIPGLPGLY